MAPTGERGRGKGKAAPRKSRPPALNSAQTAPAAPPGGGGGGRKKPPGRPFVKGQVCPNPGGRPKLLRELREKIQVRGEELVDKLFAIADDKKVRAKERVMAIEKLLAYGYGKPTQAIEVSGPGGGPVRTETLSQRTSGERRKRIEALLTKARPEASKPASAPPTEEPAPASGDATPKK